MLLSLDDTGTLTGASVRLYHALSCIIGITQGGAVINDED